MMICPVLVFCLATSAVAQDLPTLVTDVRPLLSIGVVDGAEPYLLNGVAGALRQSDGRVVVANCGSSELRFYDAAGLHVRTVGGRGGGPGEFQYLRRIYPAGGDSIGAYDGLPRHRASHFTPEGSHVRTVPLAARVEVMGRLADGALLGRAVEVQPREPGRFRRATTLYRLDAKGMVLDSLSGLPGREGVNDAQGRPRALRMERMAVLAVLSDRIAFGGQDEAVFIEYSADLQPVRRVATVTRPEEVTDAARNAWEAATDVMIPLGGTVPGYGPESAPQMPAYRHMVAGIDGRVWLQDPDRPGTYPLVWTAYQGGRPAMRVELPARFFPTQFGPDWVLGIHYDPEGIERVQLFRMQPGSHSGRSWTPRDAQPPDVPRCGAWTSR